MGQAGHQEALPGHPRLSPPHCHRLPRIPQLQVSVVLLSISEHFCSRQKAVFAKQQRLGKSEFTEVRNSSRVICALRRFQLDRSLIKSSGLLNCKRALLSLSLEILLVAMAKMSVVAFTKSVSRCDLIRLQLSWKWTPTRELSQIIITITVKTYITREQSHLCGWTSDWLPWQLLL